MIRDTFARYVILALIAILTLGALPATPAMAAGPSDLDLAFRWAPIHRQDTDDSDPDADFLTAVNFDGDWDTLNNWEHQDDNLANLKAKVYFSVVETTTHWFVLYAFYHPRDWSQGCPSTICEHENDLEGALAIVRKDGTTFGRFEGMVTVAHLDFYTFTPAGSPLTNGQEDIDGQVRMGTGPDGLPHPITFQEARGHGVKAWNGSGFPGGDGIVYSPSKTFAPAPSSSTAPLANYQLVDIFESNGLWAHRNDPLTFASWGVFRGDNGSDNSAKAPWRWDDGDDGYYLTGGELATDPAKLVDIYFNGLGAFGATYWRNAYTGIPAPIHLGLYSVTTTSIRIGWNNHPHNAVTDYYEVWRLYPTWWSVVAVLPGSVATTSWTDTGLSSGASYEYKVRACRHVEGCLDFSNTVVTKTKVPTPPSPRKLTVDVGGAGRVTSSPAGITCEQFGGDCSEIYMSGTVVTLTAAPTSEMFGFSGWTGPCANTMAETCTFTMPDTDRLVTAIFEVYPDL